ncbi:MAG: hypothetical protein HKP61_03035 [Dactylosporangium sp.]|nr:hypothetical protein [Dactylosporangium sp.]NNJ59930.1 hypothetical protein [Dactylosporangium sp.]
MTAPIGNTIGRPGFWRRSAVGQTIAGLLAPFGLAGLLAVNLTVIVVVVGPALTLLAGYERAQLPVWVLTQIAALAAVGEAAWLGWWYQNRQRVGSRCLGVLWHGVGLGALSAGIAAVYPLPLARLPVVTALAGSLVLVVSTLLLSVVPFRRLSCGRQPVAVAAVVLCSAVVAALSLPAGICLVNVVDGPYFVNPPPVRVGAGMVMSMVLRDDWLHLNQQGYFPFAPHLHLAVAGFLLVPLARDRGSPT